MFFSFDGVDGAGKTTQMELFCQWLRARGHTVVTCRDPGSTPLGEKLRAILLDEATGPMAARSEMLLYMAARAQLVDEVIAPALARGATVVCDRFLLANIVYQGYAGGLDVEMVRQVGQVATGGLRPDLTFVLDLPVDAAIARIGRKLDRMEQRSREYREALRQGFLAEAARDPDAILVLDATQPIDAIQDQIRAAATNRRGRG
jgi:dTMP kinase